MIKYIILLTTLILLSLSSCEKCGECYLVEMDGTPNEQTINLGEKCGDEFDEIDGKTYVSNDGQTRSYCN